MRNFDYLRDIQLHFQHRHRGQILLCLLDGPGHNAPDEELIIRAYGDGFHLLCRIGKAKLRSDVVNSRPTEGDATAATIPVGIRRTGECA